MNLVADLHTHTIASGHAYSTVKEMAAGAKQNGIEVMAITDHGPNMPGGSHLYHFGNLRVVPNEIEGIRIIKGVEANIFDGLGQLDLPVEVLANLDLVLAGFHVGAGYNPRSKEENTAAMINTMRNPLVDIIVHPGNPEYEVEINEVLQAAKEEQTLLEINNSSYYSRPGSKERCLEIAKKAKEIGVKLSLGTDAHYFEQVGKFDLALELVKKAELTADDILNTSVQQVLDFVAAKRKVKESLLDRN
ncbi:phosphatase [Natroniella acetigena]|uniref:phosphatase n=1 Tax=Natroniella acetigena TaxID=52004 RepID=UPI00200B8136|nr:phosphatase [Natroniella acetigena]MCK8828047.1 phosphatase [Natroniella acetigena]